MNQATIPGIDEIWERIKKYEGEEFNTSSGLPFTYEVSGEVLRTNRAHQNLPASQFAKALVRVPIEKPREIVNDIRGPAYVWAILHDPRIRQNDW